LIEVYVELSEVCQQVFDHKYEEIKSNTKAPRKGEVDSMNSVGFKSISHSQRALEMIMVKEDYCEYSISIVNL